MASPHSYTSAISPPYPSNVQLPQPPKRRQSDMPSSAPAIKRRKASMLSTTSASSAHPLRQTSFPPENAQTPNYSRSPSADTMVSGSAVGPTKKKRGRKSKTAKDDDASIAGEKSQSIVSGPSGRKRRASQEPNGEDDDDDEGGDTTVIASTGKTTEEQQQELEHRAMLVGSFDSDQMLRYEGYRSVRLPDATTRRIVNQTLSQSAPASVILAVRSVAKMFAGEIIEGARRVQTQWLEASGEDQTTGLPSPPAEGGEPKEKELRRGPLLPDHLRESIRRYKLSQEGGLVGHLGLWQLQQQNGVERFGSKVHGKRLFK